MTFGSILLATDGSDTARPALERAIELGALLHAKVTVLYVLDDASYALLPAQSDWQRIHDAMKAEAARAIEQAQAQGEAHGVRVEGSIREGDPANTIAREAADFDLVVMGTVGRSGLAHLLLGSVAEQVIRHAPCPVMVVRARDAAAASGGP